MSAAILACWIILAPSIVGVAMFAFLLWFPIASNDPRLRISKTERVVFTTLFGVFLTSALSAVFILHYLLQSMES